MGVEKVGGKALLAIANDEPWDHEIIDRYRWPTPNQMWQRTALKVAHALRRGASLREQREALQEAIDRYDDEDHYGHQTKRPGPRDPKHPACEILTTNHDAIWLGAQASVLVLASRAVELVKPSLRQLALVLLARASRWQHRHLSLLQLHAIPPRQPHAGLQVVAGCRNNSRPSYVSACVYREIAGLPHLPNDCGAGDARRAGWWRARSPTTLGPHLVRKHRALFPRADELGEQHLPKLLDPLVVVRGTDGHSAHFPEGVRGTAPRVEYARVEYYDVPRIRYGGEASLLFGRYVRISSVIAQ